ncbi:hypothetical protein EVAR_96515_1 [Eumeta japonica]|uniref:Uncharacterized protein n=1 Tax=Eumeta variegata TaxID=151549 RepID=A0A4C1WCU2_EUMVA|nr:hypothetical protein EVAR_96515_1 [Eumeta japonica]
MQAVLRACVLPNTRATRRATHRASDRPAYSVTTLNLIEIPDIHTTAPKLKSPHSNSLKCRRLGTVATTDVQNALVRPPRRLPDAEVSDAARLPCFRRRGACPDIVGTIILIVNRCFGGPSPIGKTTQTRTGARRRGHRLADACVAEPCPALVNDHSPTWCPHLPRAHAQ